MVSNEIMLKVENVSKVYRLGEIGGTTLRDELQRLGARLRHKPDPTKKVGARDYNKGEKFKALDGISFEVKKGERIGIIGHNGAGKSTLLKLISRVTGPTDGNIYLNGRVASMLEVGTGFHPELTGRENIYMNGAILGMTKKEIDAKMEEIIEFSEVRQFIDTPVKRYSSGMYVKLAFSVAAHLDSEIIIMDEVLAVGDVAFQNKCLNKMRTVSEQEDKTILYVSHNMNTIRQLCDRVIVLNKGNLIFDGNVEEGISFYSKELFLSETKFDLKSFKRDGKYCTGDVYLREIEFLSETNLFEVGSKIQFTINYSCNVKGRICFRFTIFRLDGSPVETVVCFKEQTEIGEFLDTLIFDSKLLVPDKYYANIVILNPISNSLRLNYDYVNSTMFFEIVCTNSKDYLINSWSKKLCGNVLSYNLILENSKNIND